MCAMQHAINIKFRMNDMYISVMVLNPQQNHERKYTTNNVRSKHYEENSIQ